MSYADAFGANRLERARRMYDEAPDHFIARVFPRQNLWIVRSQRRRGVHYRVFADRRLCNCPDFRQNRMTDPRFFCKHIILVVLVQRRGRLLRIRGGIERAGDIICMLYGDRTSTGGALTMEGELSHCSVEKSVSSVNAADALAFFADTHFLYPLAQVRVAGAAPATDTWDCTFESRGNGDFTVAFTGLGDVVPQLRYRVCGLRLPRDAASSAPRDVLARHVVPAVVSGDSVVTATLDTAAADGGPAVVLERLVPCRADADGNGVRVLTVHHAFSVDPETGEPRCGHVHTADRLTRWAASGAPEPCPSCVKDKMHLLMLVGGPKRKREPENLAEITGWADDLRSDIAGKTGDELRNAVRGVKAVKATGTAATGMHRLANFTVGVIQAALQAQLGELPALVMSPDVGISTRKEEMRQYLNDQGESQIWARLSKPWSAIVLVAVVAGLPADGALKGLVMAPWVGTALKQLAETRERTDEGKDQKRRRTDDRRAAAATEESGDPAPEAAPATGARAMSQLLEAETARRPELLYMRYGRDRCGEAPIRELSLGPLSSYQHIIEWASAHMAGSVDGPQSLLLNWDTGAGKACGIWLALGAAWRTAQFGNAPDNPYRAKFFFVTTAPLAYKKDPEKDVWCFYRAAGLEAHAEIRATRSARGTSKGDLWKDFLPARDSTRAEKSLATRIINYEQLRNALLLQNEYGRALYGYELGGPGQGGELKKRIEAFGKPPSNTPTSIADGDEMMKLLFHAGNVSKFRLRGLDAQVDKTKADIAKLQQQARAGDLSARNQQRLDSLQRKLVGEETSLEAATDPQKHPLDPLRDAVIAIDEADTLFSPDGVLGDSLEVIERAVFHSYAYSGRHAVRLVLATATPSHTDVRSAFRLLNMLVVKAEGRAHGCGTPGTAEDTNPTIEALLNDHRAMEKYMRAIQNGVSRVDVAEDTDRFPVRSRTQVAVAFSNVASRREYDGILARRFPGARVAEPEEVEEPEVVEEGAPDIEDEFADADDEFEDIEDAVGSTTVVKDKDREDAARGEDQEMQEEDDETPGTRVQKGLDTRAMNLRRIAMMLPHPDVRPGRLPASFQLGHDDFDPVFVQKYVSEKDRAPKLRELLANIRRIDEATFDARGYRPKHAILTSISGQLGAPLAAATLASAGYYWRPMTRRVTRPRVKGDDAPRNIVFPRPNAEERDAMAAQAAGAAAERTRLEVDAAVAEAQAGGDDERVQNLASQLGSLVSAAAREARSAVWEAEAVGDDGKPVPWSQPDIMPGAGEHLPQELTPHNLDDRAFVVLDPSMLSMPLESANYIPATRSVNNRVYADYVVGGVTELTAQLPVEVSSNPDALQTAMDAIHTVARKPLYYHPGVAELYTRSAVSADDVDVVTGLRRDASIQMDDSVRVEDLFRRGIIRWAPRLSEPQKKSAAKTTLNEMFNQASENGDGQFARIIVMAPEFLVGNDLADVEYVHLLDPPETIPDWTLVARGGRPFTRDGIQFEGRAWRRCGHANLRVTRFGPQVPTELSVLSYRLEGRTGLHSDVVIEAIRRTRKSAVRGVQDEVVANETKVADIVPAVVHVDDIARFLRTDPKEQIMLNYVKRKLNSFAFDRDTNTVRDPSAPVQTGYVYNAGDVPLLRPPDIPFGALVTNDGSPWMPVEPEMQDANLHQLWRAGLVRYQRDAAAGGPPDIEQRVIENELLLGLRKDVVSILRKRVHAGDRRTDAEVLAEAVMTKKRVGELPLPERRARVEEALRVLGIEVLFEDARDLYWKAHEHAEGIPFLASLAVARRRASYAAVATVAGPPDFSIIRYMIAALGQGRTNSILQAGGAALSDVLQVAAEVSHQLLHSIVAFFNGVWDFSVPALIEQIRLHPLVPGEGFDDYRITLFRRMAGIGSGRWSRLSTAARALFAPEWVVDDTAKTAANRRVNESLALHAMARDRSDVPPLPELVRTNRMSQERFDQIVAEREAMLLDLGLPGHPEHERVSARIAELSQEIDDLQQRFAAGFNDVLVDSAVRVRSVFNRDDAYNRALSRDFTESYIGATSTSGVRLPTETYRRMLRISQRLGLDVRDVAADFMMLTVLALRQQSEARGPMAMAAVERVRRGEELESAVLLNIAGQHAGDQLLGILGQYAFARGGQGLTAADGVKALVAEEVEGDMVKAQLVLARLAEDGEYAAGLAIAEDSEDVVPVPPFSDAAAGTPVSSKHPSFGARSARLIFYTPGKDEPKKEELANLAGVSWNDSLATWIAQSRIAIVDLSVAVGMFGRATLRDVLQRAVEIVMNPEKAGKSRRAAKEGAAESTLKQARDLVANDLLAKMEPDAAGRVRIETIDRAAIATEVDALWAAHGPGSDLSSRGQGRRDVEAVLRQYAKVFEGARLWPNADAVAAVAERTFKDVPGVRRAVLRQLVEATTDAPKRLLVEIVSDPNGGMSAVDAAAVLLGPSGPRERKTDENPRPELVLPQVWGLGASQYLSTLGTVASTAMAMANLRAHSIGESAVAEVLGDLTDFDVLVWFIDQRRPMVTSLDLITGTVTGVITQETYVQIHDDTKQARELPSDRARSDRRANRPPPQAVENMTLGEQLGHWQDVLLQADDDADMELAELADAAQAKQDANSELNEVMRTIASLPPNAQVAIWSARVEKLQESAAASADEAAVLAEAKEQLRQAQGRADAEMAEDDEAAGVQDPLFGEDLDISAVATAVAAAAPAQPTGAGVLVWYPRRKQATFPQKWDDVVAEPYDEKQGKIDDKDSLAQYDRVLIMLAWSEITVGTVAKDIAAFTGALPTGARAMIVILRLGVAGTTKEKRNPVSGVTTTVTVNPATPPFDLTALSPELVQSYGLQHGTTPFAILHIAAMRIQDTHAVHLSNNAKVRAFIAGTAPVGATVESAIQLASFIAQPLRIVEPARLAGTYLQPSDAANFVWSAEFSSSNNNSTHLLSAVAGRVQLATGATVDAWTDGGVLVEVV